jgi:hypothetical protein
MKSFQHEFSFLEGLSGWGHRVMNDILLVTSLRETYMYIPDFFQKKNFVRKQNNLESDCLVERIDGFLCSDTHT